MRPCRVYGRGVHGRSSTRRGAAWGQLAALQVAAPLAALDPGRISLGNWAAAAYDVSSQLQSCYRAVRSSRPTRRRLPKEMLLKRPWHYTAFLHGTLHLASLCAAGGVKLLQRC
eukprot:COSAG02_NODE_4659_length_5123_cov_6.685709_2_plen_114_part_00